MNLLYWAAALLFLIVHPALAQTHDSMRSQDSLGLNRMVRQVLESHPSLTAAQRDVDAATARIGQAESGYWPRVTAVGTYRRQDPVPEISVPGGLGGSGRGSSRTVRIQPNNLYDGHVEVRQTLYDFGQTSTRVGRATAGRALAERQLDVDRSKLTFQAVEAFYTTLLAEARIGVQRQQVQQLRQTLEVVQRRKKAGTATEMEIQSTRSRLSAAESRLTRFRSQRGNQEAILRRLLGRSPGDSVVLRGTLERVRPERLPVRVDSLLDHARSGHPSVQVAEAQVRAARRRVQVVDGSDAPTLALTAQGGVKNGYPSDLDEPRVNESVGISLHVPLFEGFAAGRRVDEAEASLAAAEARLTNVRRGVRSRVEQAATALEARRKQLTAADARVEQARTAARLARTQYEAGTITNLELLETETELQRARLARTEARYEVVMARYTLRRATGTLVPFSAPRE